MSENWVCFDFVWVFLYVALLLVVLLTVLVSKYQNPEENNGFLFLFLLLWTAVIN